MTARAVLWKDQKHLQGPLNKPCPRASTGPLVLPTPRLETLPVVLGRPREGGIPVGSRKPSGALARIPFSPLIFFTSLYVYEGKRAALPVFTAPSLPACATLSDH